MNSKTLVSQAYDSLYKATAYAIGFSSMVGLGNGLAQHVQGESFRHGFGTGYVNHFLTSLLVASTYKLVIEKSPQKNRRLYANLYHGMVISGFVAWHHIVGTENPFQAVLPAGAVGFAMVNRHVSDTLEEKLEAKH